MREVFALLQGKEGKEMEIFRSTRRQHLIFYMLVLGLCSERRVCCVLPCPDIAWPELLTDQGEWSVSTYPPTHLHM